VEQTELETFGENMNTAKYLKEHVMTPRFPKAEGHLVEYLEVFM
jgi:hypothetical protein